ncbi:hypothetical protein KY358_04150 [Candidatus Woesearchaeota archaeon]|nr:hypothetical protein [Candidatus Woesearchaeota archaeon]
MTDKRINFILDEEVYREFSVLCEELAIVRSKHIENYLKKFIKQKRKLVKDVRL